MYLKATLLLLRRRILITAVVSAVMVLAVLFLTSADGITDVGVLWHHFCGCPPDPADALILLYSPLVMALIVDIILGAGSGSALLPATRGEALYLLTRPIRRDLTPVQAFFASSLLTMLLPVLAWGLLLGWLRLVHAPALGHMADLLRLVPGAAEMPPAASLLQLLSAIHAGRRSLGALSVALCASALFNSQRWFALSPFKPLRVIAGLTPLLFPMAPFALRYAGLRTQSWLLLTPPEKHAQALGYVPSVTGIAAHLAVAAAWLALTAYAARRTEL